MNELEHLTLFVLNADDVTVGTALNKAAQLQEHIQSIVEMQCLLEDTSIPENDKTTLYKTAAILRKCMGDIHMSKEHYPPPSGISNS